jgi:hypothetical protein
VSRPVLASQLSHFPDRRVLKEGLVALRRLCHAPVMKIRIVYRIVPGQVQILRFWHAARGAPEINVDEFID